MDCVGLLKRQTQYRFGASQNDTKRERETERRRWGEREREREREREGWLIFNEFLRILQSKHPEGSSFLFNMKCSLS
jgi:hypothetical protein